MEGLFGRHLWLMVALLVLEFGSQGGGCLRDVSLTVNPPAVQRGHHASLLCRYDLEGAPLYTVKYYRGRLEFYRYSPGEIPAVKVFAYQGIHVDLSMSNETQVVLREVGFNLSGNFSCEVTVEAPSFSTATVYTHLLVVELPNGPPQIQTAQKLYFPGDTLRANCTSPPSKPVTRLTFMVNNITIGQSSARYTHSEESLLRSSAMSMAIQLLPSHFSNGQLVLKCTASVASLYSNSSEVTLGARPKEPVPERVTSSNAAKIPTVTLPLLFLMGYRIMAR